MYGSGFCRPNESCLEGSQLLPVHSSPPPHGFVFFHCRLSQNLFLVTKVTQAFIYSHPPSLLLVVCILRLEEQEKCCHGRQSQPSHWVLRSLWAKQGLTPSAPPWVGTAVVGCPVPFTICLRHQRPPLVPEHTILIAICLGPQAPPSLPNSVLLLIAGPFPTQ